MSWATTSVRSIPFFFFTGVSKVSTDSFMWEICLTSKGQWDSWMYFLEKCVHLSNTAKYWNRNFISWDIYFLWKTNTLGCAVRFIHFQFPEIAKTCQAVTHVLKIICWVQHFILVGSVIARIWVLHYFLQQRFLLSKVNKILYNSAYSCDWFFSLSSLSIHKNWM